MSFARFGLECRTHSALGLKTPEPLTPMKIDSITATDRAVAPTTSSIR